MNIDVASVRADTPGCENVLHLNNAGASLSPEIVVERVKAHLDLEAEIGAYEAADRVADEYERIYASIARMLRCTAGEIALVDSATRAWDVAFYTLAEQFHPSDIILTATNEYASNYIAFLQTVRKRGIEIVVIPSVATGEISLQALEETIRQHGERVKLVTLTHVPTNGGLVQPAAAVGQITRRYGIPFLLDACQSVGQMPLPVEELGCDILSATGRKYLRGPRGTGFLYVRQALLEKLEPVQLDMRAAQWVARDKYEIRNDARRFETWESSIACRLGLGVAVEYAMAIGLSAIQERIALLADQLRRQLASITSVTVQDLPVGISNLQGNDKPALCGIATFTHVKYSAQQIFEQMRDQRINVRVTPVFGTRIDMEQRGLPEMVRASVHYYNTEEEFVRFAKAISLL